MTSPYRDATHAIAHEAEVLCHTRLRELQELPPEIRELYVRRKARVCFGMVGTLGAIAMVASLFVGGGQSYILIATWCLAFGLARRAKKYAGRDWDKRMAIPARTNDPYHDFATLQAFCPRKQATDLVQSLEKMSVALPLTAHSLLVPITLHFIVFITVSFPTIGTAEDTSLHDVLSGFDGWILISAILVSQAHLVFVRAAWQFHEKQTPWLTLAWAVFAACVPGVILLAIPPALTALTGTLLVTIAFEPMGKLLQEERVVILANAL